MQQGQVELVCPETDTREPCAAGDVRIILAPFSAQDADSAEGPPVETESPQGEDGKPAETGFLLALQCDNWVYVIAPDQPALLDTSDPPGHLLLPCADGNAFALSVPPSALGTAEWPAFLAKLAGACRLKHRDSDSILAPETDFAALTTPPDAPAWSKGIVAGIGFAGAVTALGVKKAASVTSAALGTIGNAVVSRTPSRAEPVKVSDATKQRVTRLQGVAQTSLKFSASFVQAISTGAVAAGHAVADGVGRLTGASDAKPESGNAPPPKRSELTAGMMAVAKAGLGAYTEVWDALEEGAVAVGSESAAQATALAAKRYGDEAAEVAAGALHAAGSLAFSAYRINGMGVKAVAKTAASTAATKVAMQSMQG